MHWYPSKTLGALINEYPALYPAQVLALHEPAATAIHSVPIATIESAVVTVLKALDPIAVLSNPVVEDNPDS